MHQPIKVGKGTRARAAATLVVILASTGCVPAGHLNSEHASAPVFDPIQFFAGKTKGTGSLAIVMRHRQSTLVTGLGVVGPDQSIVLDQDVQRGNGKPKHRTWLLRRSAVGHYTGTITDAVGPVAGDVEGNCLHLRFAMKGGLHAQQWLYLRSGGQVAQNRMVVTKFGIPVVSLNETITRKPS